MPLCPCVPIGRAAPVLWLLAAFSLAIHPAQSQAQSDAPPPNPETSGSGVLRQPPKLTVFVEAVYPPEAIANGDEGEVVMTLTIDEGGRVIDAEVVESASFAFDASALAAARQFRFEPARRQGTPVLSRIRYRYVFQLPPAPAVGSISGRAVLAGAAEAPAVGVLVQLSSATGTVADVRTGPQGQFDFDGLQPGAYLVEIRAKGLGAASVPVAVAAEQVAQPMLRLMPDAAEPVLEVTVQGRSEADRLRRSAQAVQVIEVEEAKRETADLGEVLARTQGIGVRRSGGLGSEAAFSLNGLSGDQVRFFLDGVPLELSGYTFGIANVPVALTERVEVFRGVVPIRFGADALGGGVNLVTSDDLAGTAASVSYLAGDFNTHRVAASARTLFDESGFFVRGSGFLDVTDNNYDIDVDVPNAVGNPIAANPHRFHDGYRAGGGNLELGFVDRPWAERLVLRGFVTDVSQEIQNNVVMTVPYGEVRSGEFTAGATLRYKHALSDNVTFEAVGGYTYSATEFLDVSTCIYSWFGTCIDDPDNPGEIPPVPTDQILWEQTAYGRVNLAWRVHPQHQLRLSVAPTLTTQTGDERLDNNTDRRDPLTAERNLLNLVSGIEYELRLDQDRFQNIVFVKSYVQFLSSEEPLSADRFRSVDRNTARFGLGNALRFLWTEGLYTKASYEFATRLPRPAEVFGNGVLIAPNLELEPELSHNVNLGLVLDLDDIDSGWWDFEVHGFLRETDQLINLVGNDRFFNFENVSSARSVGVEGRAAWTSPGRYIAIDTNLTYFDFRSTTDVPALGLLEGDRIPNQPFFFANASARVQLTDLMASGDQVVLFWNTRFVDEFFRTSESAGNPSFKPTVDRQVISSVGLTYSVSKENNQISLTGEWQNVTDEPAFDFFGVQRPGRAFFFKLTGAFEGHNPR